MGTQLVLFECGIAMVSGIAALTIIFCRDLDTLGLGENKASTLGVTVNKVQISVLVLAVALSTTAVAILWSDAFFRLSCSTSCSSLVGGRHRTLLPAALIIGALLLQLSDILARVIDPPLNYQRVF